MIPDSKRTPVVFIVSNATDSSKATPVGTGFLASVPAEGAGDWGYVVTCGHVVALTPDAGVRFGIKGGETRDFLVKRWYHHPTEDVAVAEFDPPDLLAENVDHYAFGISQGLEESTPHQPDLGAVVQYTGLLGNVPSMGSSLTPMVRTGTIGALYQHGVPMVGLDQKVRNVRGHLIDCRSISGFSGSPVTVAFDRNLGRTTPRLGLTLEDSFFYLLGMIGGHFDVSKTVDLSNSQDIRVSVGAGVGVVYPFDVIREALFHEELVERRQGDETEQD